jgi:hypothetical protein
MNGVLQAMVVAAVVNYGSATGDLRSPDLLVVSLTATRELVTQQDSVGARRAAERAVSDFLDLAGQPRHGTASVQDDRSVHDLVGYLRHPFPSSGVL